MAALRGTLEADRSTETRLSHRVLTAKADTWQTFTSVTLAKDGSGRFTVKQNGQEIVSLSWAAETAEPSVAVTLFGRTGETLYAQDGSGEPSDGTGEES